MNEKTPFIQEAFRGKTSVSFPKTQSAKERERNPKSLCTILTKDEFLNDFGLEAKKAACAEEVFSMVMNVDPLNNNEGNVPKHVVTIFKNVPTGTTKKRLRFDNVSRLSSDEAGVIAINSMIPFACRFTGIEEHIRGIDHFTQTLTKQGVEVTEQNPPVKGLKGIKTRIFPFTGREHKKASYIKYPDGENDIFYLPSANYDSGLSADIVLKFTSNNATLLIQSFNDAIAAEGSGKDIAQKLSDKLSIYVDRGTPNQSIILDKGVDLIRNANESIQLCSWLYPDGIIAEELEKAHQNSIHVEVLTTKMRPSLPLYSGNNILFAANMLASTKPHSYNIDKFTFGGMHPKMLIVDGKFVFVGSNNLSEKGKKAGTSEFQVLIDDAEIADQLSTQFYDFQAMIRYESQVMNFTKK